MRFFGSLAGCWSCAGSVNDHNASPLALVANDWSDRQVTFETDTTRGRANRYVYTLVADSSLKMAWYPGAGGHWVLGDSLVCARAR